MEINAAKILEEYSGKLRINYSGRGMYGKYTAGVFFDDVQSFYQAIGHILIEEDVETRETTSRAMGSIQFDDMACGVIVY